MTRLVAISTVAAVLATAPASAEPAWPERWQTARFRTLDWPDGSFSVRENLLTVKAAARRFGVDFSRMLCIAERESGLNEHAYNASSGASGIFQHLATYWRGRVVAYRAPPSLYVRPGASVFNARANVLVSARLMAMGQWFHWTATDGSCS